MVTLDGLRDQAKRVVAPIMLAAVVTSGSAGKVDAQQTTNNDSFVAAKEIAKPVSTSSNISVKTLDSVIANATKAGALKGPKDFTTKDKSGNQVEDSSAYETYIAGLKERANRTSDPVGNLNSVISTANRLVKAGVFSETDRNLVLDHEDYGSSILVLGKIYGQFKNDSSVNIEQLIKEKEDLFIQLGFNKKSNTLASIK